MGGHGVGEVAGGGAGDRLEAELARPRHGDRDDAVLEGVGRVGGVVLDPHLAQAEALGEPVGADQRRAARGQPDARGQAPGGAGRPAGERQEVGVAPDVLRPALDAAAQLADVVARAAAVVVDDLQRAEALLADVQRLQRVLGFALLALQMTDSHLGLLRSMSSPCHVWRRARSPPHISLELAPSRCDIDGGCRGFVGPVPPPLWMCPAMWRGSLATVRTAGTS